LAAACAGGSQKNAEDEKARSGDRQSKIRADDNYAQKKQNSDFGRITEQKLQA